MPLKLSLPLSSYLRPGNGDLFVGSRKNTHILHYGPRSIRDLHKALSLKLTEGKLKAYGRLIVKLTGVKNGNGLLVTAQGFVLPGASAGLLSSPIQCQYASSASNSPPQFEQVHVHAIFPQRTVTFSLGASFGVPQLGHVMIHNILYPSSFSSTGYPASCQASSPPSMAYASYPCFLRKNATLALVSSLGQVQ